jgi:hypothetical protein
MSGVNKGTLSGSGPTYTLPISGFTAGGSLSVSVAKPGYTISGGSKTVTIYYNSGSSGGNGEWSKWVDPSTSITLDIEEQQGGITKITVGGTPSDDWKAHAAYTNSDQTLQQGKYYKYTFETWTDSGTRTVKLQYYGDEDAEIYYHFWPYVTTEHKTYELVSLIPHPKAKEAHLQFQCGDTVGTFYVKIISIAEASAPLEKTLEITNIDSEIFSEMESYSFWLGVFAQGTTIEQALGYEKLAAVANGSYVEFSNNTATATLINTDEWDKSLGWRGSGTYNILIIRGSSKYFSTNVVFSPNSATASVNWNTFSQVGGE